MMTESAAQAPATWCQLRLRRQQVRQPAAEQGRESLPSMRVPWPAMRLAARARRTTLPTSVRRCAQPSASFNQKLGGETAAGRVSRTL